MNIFNEEYFFSRQQNDWEKKMNEEKKDEKSKFEWAHANQTQQMISSYVLSLRRLWKLIL